ncbi:MAG: NIL domain-containing protein [Acutalibacteraceae bacterium]
MLSASTRNIGGKVYGSMLLGISGGAEQLNNAVDYLHSIPDIFAQEVKFNA